jgi:hypothetical protein
MTMSVGVGTLERAIVAKKKAGRPKSQNPRGDGRQVRLDPDVVAKAKMVATRKGLEVGPYLSTLLEAPINREYAVLLRELASLEGGK